MRKIGDISLFKFSQVDEINAREIPDIDKLLFSTCVIYDLTEYQLDHMKPRKALRLISKIEKLFKGGFEPKAATKIGKYKINYDPSALTFGQYIELMFFLDQPLIQAAHYVLASIVSTEDDHPGRSQYFLSRPVAEAMGTVIKYVENLNKFNKEYAALFGVDPEVNGDVSTDKFIKRYGWIYSASRVAEYERITLDDCYKLPIRRALNNLAYLKAKDKFESNQMKTK
jgi:hypothetical protein